MKYKEKQITFNENFMEIIIKNIVKYRKLRGMTQEELAYYTDLSNEFIRRIETCYGKRGVSLKTLYKIATVLEVPIDKFFEE